MRAKTRSHRDDPSEAQEKPERGPLPLPRITLMPTRARTQTFLLPLPAKRGGGGVGHTSRFKTVHGKTPSRRGDRDDKLDSSRRSFPLFREGAGSAFFFLVREGAPGLWRCVVQTWVGAVMKENGLSGSCQRSRGRGRKWGDVGGPPATRRQGPRGAGKPRQTFISADELPP